MAVEQAAARMQDARQGVEQAQVVTVRSERTDRVAQQRGDGVAGC